MRAASPIRIISASPSRRALSAASITRGSSPSASTIRRVLARALSISLSSGCMSNLSETLEHRTEKWTKVLGKIRCSNKKIERVRPIGRTRSLMDQGESADHEQGDEQCLGDYQDDCRMADFTHAFERCAHADGGNT